MCVTWHLTINLLIYPICLQYFSLSPCSYSDLLFKVGTDGDFLLMQKFTSQKYNNVRARVLNCNCNCQYTRMIED